MFQSSDYGGNIGLESPEETMTITPEEKQLYKEMHGFNYDKYRHGPDLMNVPLFEVPVERKSCPNCGYDGCDCLYNLIIDWMEEKK